MPEHSTVPGREAAGSNYGFYLKQQMDLRGITDALRVETTNGMSNPKTKRKKIEKLEVSNPFHIHETFLQLLQFVDSGYALGIRMVSCFLFAFCSSVKATLIRIQPVEPSPFVFLAAIKAGYSNESA